MKAIFYLPAHPSYFGDEYTQDEIDEAIRLYDQQTGGFISKGNDRPKVRQEVILLRHPGKPLALMFESSGYGDGKEVPEAVKDYGVNQYCAVTTKDLQTHVHNITELLKYIRARSGHGDDRPPPRLRR